MNHLHYRRALNGLGQVPRYTPGQLFEDQVIGAGIGLDMVSFDLSYIPPGTFMMGSDKNNPDTRPDEVPVHQVTITRGFLLGRTEVTQSQWLSIMGTDPSIFKGMNNPVENVSWFDAIEYCNALSSLADLPLVYEIDDNKNVKIMRTTGYRLPTEAEWEYACRAGVNRSRYGPINSIAWYSENSQNKTHPVGTKDPNPWNVYDMLGNVFEWVQDWYSRYAPNRQIDPDGGVGGSYRVFRGGSWNDVARFVRAGYRGIAESGRRSYGLGFRICRSLE